MAFEFMQEPEWRDLHIDEKKGVIDLSFRDEIEADPAWESIPDDEKTAIKDLYFKEARATDDYLATPETRGAVKSVGAGLAHGGLGLLETAGTAMQYVGERLDFPELADYGKDTSEYWEDKAKKYGPAKDIGGKNLWDNPELLADTSWWLYNVSDMVPALATTVAPGGAAVKVVSAVPKLARFAGFAGSAVGGLFGGGIEAAQTYKAVLEAGGTEEQAARSGELMWAGAGVLNALGVGKILGKAGNTFMGRVKKHLGAAAWEGLTEGAEEPTEVFSKYLGAYLADEPLPDDLKEQLEESLKDALTVAPIAGVVGGGASLLSSQDVDDMSKPPPSVLNAPDVDTAVKNFEDEINSVLGKQRITPTLSLPAPEGYASGEDFTMGPTGPVDRPGLMRQMQQAEIDRFEPPETGFEPTGQPPEGPGPSAPAAPEPIDQVETWLEGVESGAIDIYSPEAIQFFQANADEITSRIDVEGQVETLANEAATSPENDLPEPSDEQKKAGNAKLGHIPGKLVNMAGMSITVENPRGSVRTETKPDDAPSDWEPSWSTEMKHHYGYFTRTEGKDGDQIDVFIGPAVGSKKAFIVDQVDDQGNFDEHKTLIGFKDEAAARQGYLDNYEEGWSGLGAITEMPIDEFKAWLGEGKRKTEPVGDIAFTPEEEAPRTVEEIQAEQEDLDAQIAALQADSDAKKAAAADEIAAAQEAFGDLPVRIDMVGEEGTTVPPDEMQVTFLDIPGKEDTVAVPRDIEGAKAKIQEILKERTKAAGGPTPKRPKSQEKQEEPEKPSERSQIAEPDFERELGYTDQAMEVVVQSKDPEADMKEAIRLRDHYRKRADELLEAEDLDTVMEEKTTDLAQYYSEMVQAFEGKPQFEKSMQNARERLGLEAKKKMEAPPIKKKAEPGPEWQKTKKALIYSDHDTGLQKIVAQYFDDVSAMVKFPDLSHTSDFATKREMVEKWMQSYFEVDEEAKIQDQFDRLEAWTKRRLDETAYPELIGGEIEDAMPKDLADELKGTAADQVDQDQDLGENKYHGKDFFDSRGVNEFIEEHLDYNRLPEGDMDTVAASDGVGDFAGKMVYPLDDGRFYVVWNEQDVEMNKSQGMPEAYQFAVVPESREGEINYYKEYESMAAPAKLEPAGPSVSRETETTEHLKQIPAEAFVIGSEKKAILASNGVKLYSTVEEAQAMLDEVGPRLADDGMTDYLIRIHKHQIENPPKSLPYSEDYEITDEKGKKTGATAKVEGDAYADLARAKADEKRYSDLLNCLGT